MREFLLSLILLFCMISCSEEINNLKSNNSLSEKELLELRKNGKISKDQLQQLCTILYKKGDLRTTISIIDEVLTLDSIQPELLLKKAEIQVFLNQLPLAIQTINKSLKINPYQREGYFLKGLCYKYIHNDSLAISSFRTATEIDPNFSEAHLELALLYLDNENNLAEAFFKNVLEIDAVNQEALYGLSFYYQEVGDYKQSKFLIEKLLKEYPDHIDGWFNLGSQFFKEMKYDSAKYCFKNEFGLRSDPRFFYMLGVINAKTEMMDSAYFCFEKALKIDSTYLLAKDALQRLSTRK